MQDLFTAPELRGKGLGKALIEGVCQQARLAGIQRVYWQTPHHQRNRAAAVRQGGGAQPVYHLFT